MKERNIKELLQLMMDNQGLFCAGLCVWTNILFYQSIISISECFILREYIKSNRPSMFSSFDAFIHSIEGYYWKQGDIKPRIKWIQKHIKKNS
jgi:hypothetical protein